MAKCLVNHTGYLYKLHNYIFILYRGKNNRDIKYILIHVDTSLHI